MLASVWIFDIIFIEISKLQPWWRSDNVGAPQQGLHGGGQEDHERGSIPSQLFFCQYLNIAKGTTDPRVEFISQDHSSQILNILQFQNLD